MNTVIHCSIDKKAVDAYYTGLTEEIQTNPKACEFKIDKRIKIRNIYKSLHEKIGQKKFFLLILY